MQPFFLYRMKDVSGVSGEGFVAEGGKFLDGTCVLKWLGEMSSTGIYKNLKDIEDIHGHQGSTIVVWEDHDVMTEDGKLAMQEMGTGFTLAVNNEWIGHGFKACKPSEWIKYGKEAPFRILHI